MKKKTLSILAGSVLAFLLAYNIGFTSNTHSGDISLAILSSQAVECRSECTNYPGCSIKMDCSGLCVEKENYFVCAADTFMCSWYCSK